MLYETIIPASGSSFTKKNFIFKHFPPDWHYHPEYELVATRSIAARADAPLTLEQIEAYTAQDENPWPRFSWDLLVPPGLILLALIWLIRFIRRHRKKRIKAPKIKPIKKKYLR